MPDSQRPRPRDLVPGVLAGAVLGAVVGTIGTFKHRVGLSAGLPVGLVASIAMIALVLLALRLSSPARFSTGAAAVGVVAAVGVLSLPGPGGSRVVLEDPAGVVWVVAPFVVGALVVAWPRRLRRRGGQAPDGILAADGRTGTDK